MTTETETKKASPTVAELEQKVTRLQEQAKNDERESVKASDAFTRAVKSGNVDEALSLADARSKAQSTLAKTVGQLKTAQGGVASAKHTLNADKIAAIHDAMRDSREVEGYFTALSEFGVTRVVVERSEDGKLLISSSGPKAPKRSGGGGGGGGGGAQPLTVDGETFESASKALTHHYPEFTGKMGRSAIVSRLVAAGHTVS